MFGAGIDDYVIGTLAFFQVAAGQAGPFDWIDLFEAQTVGIRSGDLGIACVLNDGGAVGRRLGSLPTHPLTPVQFREIVAVLAANNLDLERRPRFYTEPQPGGLPTTHIIRTERALDSFGPPNATRFGEILAFVMRDLLHALELDGSRDCDEIRAKLKTGRYSLLRHRTGVPPT